MRAWLSIAASVLPLVTCASALALTPPPPITMRQVASGLPTPVEIANAGDGTGRLFIVGQRGTISIFKDGAVLPTPFLDIRSRVAFDFAERGLLGLAFDPRFATNRRFFVFYTMLPNDGTGGSLRVSSFLASTVNPDVADPASENEVITIPHPINGNHNGGHIAFGPDGYLYIGTGDGGGANDDAMNSQSLSVLLGKMLRLDVNGSAATPTGTVDFRANGASISGCSAVALVSGVATCTTTSLPVMTNALVAQYSGDVSYSSALSPGATVPVYGNATIVITSSANPTSAGAPVAFTATFSAPSGTPSGLVSFNIDGSTIPGCGSVGIVSTKAICNTALVVQGGHAITASYTGDANFFPGSATPFSETVVASAGGNATVALTFARASPAFGQAVTFTTTVTGASGTPAGTVDFRANGASIAGCSAVALASGVATCTTSALPVMTNAVVAQYSGNTSYGAMASPGVSVPVYGNATIVITASANPTNMGAPVAFTATFSAPSGTPTGLVSFGIDGSTIPGCGSVGIASAKAVCNTALVVQGTHAITATYTGDANFFSGGAAPFSATVVSNGGATVALAFARASPAFGQAVTFTTTVTGASGTPTGTVDFRANGASIAGCSTVALASGVATCTTSALPVMTNAVVAQYSGNATYGSAFSSGVTVPVYGNATIALTASANPTTVGAPVTFTATFSAPSGTPTGLVSFGIDGTMIPGCGNVGVASAKAVCNSALVVLGAHTITATYTGDANFFSGSATPSSETVVASGASSTVALTFARASPAFGQAVTLTATVSGLGGYAIPPTNPFVGMGAGVRGEIWAYGLRNPWRYTFDRGTGDLYIGDVGQGAIEEVDYVPAAMMGGGFNFGWRVFEGTICRPPTTGCSLLNHTPPVLQYAHDGAGGTTVIGGYVYRGLRSAALRGFYLYADFGSNHLWAAQHDGSAWTTTLLLNPTPLGSITTFGEDEAGELYVAGIGGQLYAIDGPGPAYAPLPAMAIVPRPWAFDFDADGKTDLTWHSIRAEHSIWLMNGLAFRDANYAAAGAGSTIRLAADFDGNGKTDLLWRGADGGYDLQLMNGLSVASSAHMRDAGTAWEVVGGGDFNGDGKLDLLWKHASGTYETWLMNGTGAPAIAALPRPGPGWDVALIGDFDGDGRADLLWRHVDGRVLVTLMNGASIVSTSAVLLGADSGWSPTHAGDFDGDGMTDVLWKHTDGSQRIWLMNGASIRSLGTILGPGTGWSVRLTADLDGDGRTDLVWAHEDGGVAVWTMNGLTATGTAALFGGGSGWAPAATGDFDGDHKADIVFRNIDGSHGIWLMNGLAGKAMMQIVGPGTGWSVVP